jgi:hypothetical protein
MASQIWQWWAIDTAGAIRDDSVISEEVVRAHRPDAVRLPPAPTTTHSMEVA